MSGAVEYQLSNEKTRIIEICLPVYSFRMLVALKILNSAK